jgi:hypothetical protein
MYKPKQRDIIIDPMSCLIKLSVLGYFPDGTKISIAQNKIFFNEPTLMQGVIRFFQSDNREDLHNLFNPIQKSIKWYWNPDDEGSQYLFNLATDGLKMLKKAYPIHSTIQHTLDYYINIIAHKDIIDDATMAPTTQNTSIYEFLKGLWNPREINIIIELLKEYKNKISTPTAVIDREAETLLATINAMTDIKDGKLNTFLFEHSTIL